MRLQVHEGYSWTTHPVQTDHDKESVRSGAQVGRGGESSGDHQGRDSSLVLKVTLVRAKVRRDWVSQDQMWPQNLKSHTKFWVSLHSPWKPHGLCLDISEPLAWASEGDISHVDNTASVEWDPLCVSLISEPNLALEVFLASCISHQYHWQGWSPQSQPDPERVDSQAHEDHRQSMSILASLLGQRF